MMLIVLIKKIKLNIRVSLQEENGKFGLSRIEFERLVKYLDGDVQLIEILIQFRGENVLYKRFRFKKYLYVGQS